MRVILIILIVVCSLKVRSQNCKDFYYFNKDMTVEFTGFRLSQSGRSLEREDLTYALKFEEMEANNDFCQSKMIQSVPTNKKKTKGVDLTFFYLMNVDTLKMPINNWMGVWSKQRAAVETDKDNDNLFVVYPPDMSVGQTFQDLKGRKTGYDAEGRKAKINVEIKNRKVEKKETITTSAGTWEAYKMTFDYRISFEKDLRSPGASPDFTFKWEEWFVPKFGIIKVNNYMGSSVVSSATISSIKK